MSGRQRPTPQRRELEIMRVLFERRLKDRAVALADSRWPGSGQMVELAYDWSQLSPEQRRERLSAIGPEEIARLREFAELNPSLAAAVSELERRGALPHIEAAVVDIAAASRESTAPASTTTTEALEAELGPAPELEIEPEPEPAAAAQVETETGDATQASTSTEPEPVVEVSEEAAQSADFADVELNVNPLQVKMPELDLGLPDTSQVLEEEARRREELTRATQESMERVRQRLEQSAQRAFERSSNTSFSRIPEISRPTLPSVTSAAFSTARQITTSAASSPATNLIDAPRSLAEEFARRVVVTLGPRDPRPSDDELVALANDLQIGLSEHRITYENRKEELGGLVKEGGRITPRPGRLARAVAEPNLVVVRGRLLPRLAERLEEGYFDIPGTRATVRLHPKTRVLLIGD